MQPENSAENIAEIAVEAPRKQPSFIKETLRFALFALLVVVPIRVYIAQPFIVSGASMQPTFEDSEYLIVDQVSMHVRELTRGEVIIFKYPADPSRYYIKRIIGLPGETVTIDGSTISIRPADGSTEFTLEEPYLPTTRTRPDNLSMALADDEYFVMGDNRLVSSDSRVWGPLKREFIVGEPFVRLYPLSRADLFPGADLVNQPALAN